MVGGRNFTAIIVSLPCFQIGNLILAICIGIEFTTGAGIVIIPTVFCTGCGLSADQFTGASVGKVKIVAIHYSAISQGNLLSTDTHLISGSIGTIINFADRVVARTCCADILTTGDQIYLTAAIHSINTAVIRIGMGILIDNYNPFAQFADSTGNMDAIRSTNEFNSAVFTTSDVVNCTGHIQRPQRLNNHRTVGFTNSIDPAPAININHIRTFVVSRENFNRTSLAADAVDPVSIFLQTDTICITGTGTLQRNLTSRAAYITNATCRTGFSDFGHQNRSTTHNGNNTALTTDTINTSTILQGQVSCINLIIGYTQVRQRCIRNRTCSTRNCNSTSFTAHIGQHGTIFNIERIGR